MGCPGGLAGCIGCCIGSLGLFAPPVVVIIIKKEEEKDGMNNRKSEIEIESERVREREC